MSSIYEITSSYMRLQELMDDPELDPQTLADTMEAIEGELEIKAESYGKIMKNMEADVRELEGVIESLMDEVKRITFKKKIIESNIKAMKERLKQSMEITGKTQIKTNLFSFSVSNIKPTVIIDSDDIEAFPEEFIRTKKEIDKKALYEAMNASDIKSILGLAHLEEGTRLNIR